ncbi:phosphatidate cytidylyltransferase [Teredinibacter sp. KSP-S5-2]|uniref:phosphatidate cytidylyltransferase n=1 Tax=Teredinibacter sp. KSP-S5-2 TaxID=3034506 RepID=UPI002934E663|nr:phosphatidate cytidylyltransferase [Teredinibacter sp. KSP-S5-2]WNO09828.1 phosphatidate cytidylyltransferase [Teredinibacter sp. KSP-S5-2]
MLKQRVFTALVLTGSFLLVLFFLPWYIFACFVSVIFCVAAWEWARLSGINSQIGRIVYAFLLLSLSAGGYWWSDWGSDTAFVQSILIVACCWWAFSFFWIQGYPSSSVIWGGMIPRALMGVLVIVPAWIASTYIYSRDNGHWLILFIVFLVASADIGAYFTGRAFGVRKLAPDVSPGKSWEGVWGGLVAAVLLATLFNFIFQAGYWLPLLAIAIPTSLVSVIGDLLESMVKRHAGVKDSSQLLPGHGGVLDRIDGLVAAVPVFTLAYISTPWHL